MHKPSGTLIATDLVWNYPGSGTPRGTQAWKFGMDRVYLPFYKRFMIKDKGMSGLEFHAIKAVMWPVLMPIQQHLQLAADSSGICLTSDATSMSDAVHINDACL